MKYTFDITRYFVKTVTIEAASEDEALQELEYRYGRVASNIDGFKHEATKVEKHYGKKGEQSLFDKELEISEEDMTYEF